MLRKWVTLVMTLCLTLSTQPAQAFDLSELQQRLGGSTLIRGDFKQTKEIAMLSQPLVSSGNFVLSETHGLLWQQKAPFPVTLILSEQTLRQQMPGQPEQVIRASDNPMAFYFSDLFLGLFHADADVLTQQFEVNLDGDAQHWTLLLTPSKPPLTQVFRQITLSGSDNIDALVLDELRGDKTTISFNDIQHTPIELSDEERRAFND